ncbi:MAG: tetratricopeptide repeat protein [Gammaproteobacteria bacterium]|nr:tetratricopeptide repeat protein [Gammaproteobacteria bacterium]
MSLINQMLRDLEERKRREQPSLTDIRAVDTPRRRGALRMVLAMGLLLAGVAAYIFWRQPHGTSPAVALVQPPPAVVTHAKSAGPHSRATPLTAHRTARASIASNARMPERTPVAADAAVMATDNNPAAPPGNRLAASLPQNARLTGAQAVSSGSAAGVQLGFNAPVSWVLRSFPKTSWVSLEIKDVGSVADVIRALPLPAMVTGVSYTLTPDQRLLLAFTVLPGTQAATQPAAPGSGNSLQIYFTAAATPPSAPAVASMMKSPANVPPALQSAQAYNQGVRALQQGQNAAAEQLFRSALDSNPDNAAAREALTALYARSGRGPEAEQLLVTGLTLNTANRPRFAKLYASLLMQRGADAQAIQVLDANKPDIHADADYYALLAALEQRSGRNREAVALYRQLLAVDPGQGVWWAGLGISLEQLGEPDTALAAYTHAQAAGSLDDALARYVQNRINALKH